MPLFRLVSEERTRVHFVQKSGLAAGRGGGHFYC